MRSVGIALTPGALVPTGLSPRLRPAGILKGHTLGGFVRLLPVPATLVGPSKILAGVVLSFVGGGRGRAR